MQRIKPNLAVMAMLFIVGIGTVTRFSPGVRAVDVVGLSGGGAACGAAIFGFIFALASRKNV